LLAAVPELHQNSHVFDFFFKKKQSEIKMSGKQLALLKNESFSALKVRVI
jgi:hypothetical protein